MAKPIDVLVLSKLDDINKKLVLVLNNQKKWEEALTGNLPVIPELEKAVNHALWLSVGIDRKVPDLPNKPLGKKVQRKKG